MKGFVLYDSAYGNTKKVAETIARTLGVSLVAVERADAEDVRGADLVIVGSPTQGGKATERLQKFLGKFPAHSLDGVAVAAFDTRFDQNAHGLFLKVVMKTINFAAPRIAKKLQAAGGTLITEPHGFIVKDTKGPLQPHELDEAKQWAQSISRKLVVS